MVHTQHDRTRSHKATVTILTVLLIFSAGLNVLLSRELQRAQRTPSRAPATGTLVPALAGRTPEGHPLTISFDRQLPTVLYYFSAECGWCERNWANVDAMRAETQERYRFIGIAATARVPAYMENTAIPLTIVTGLDATTRAAYRFSGTPHTVVVGPDGRVIDSWLGAWDGAQARAVSARFGATLPGLSPRRPSQ
jgi:hypothetical protein